MEKEEHSVPEAMADAEPERPEAARPLPPDSQARALQAENDPALFSARALSSTITVELSTSGKVVGNVIFALDDANHTAALVQADPGQSVDGMLVIPRTLTHQDTEYTVTAIGPAAFAEQTGLTQLWLPQTITEIGYEAFMNCDRLKAVGSYDDQGYANPYALPEKVSFLDVRTFRGCTRLNSITIPAAVERISAWAFAYCYNLGRNYKDSAGVTYGVYFAAGSRLNTIDQGAFYSCISLENITLPQGLKTISLHAFYNCASQSADGSLKGLKKLVIPNSVSELGEEAFAYCGALKELTIPAGVKALPNKAFYACSALETVDFTGDGFTTMGHSAFYWCTKLKTIRTAGNAGLPATLTAIPRWGFYRCDSLSALDLSGATALRTIEPYAFNESGIVTLTLPQNLKTIGMLAFEGCGKLKTVNWNRPAQDSDLLVVGEKAFAKTGLTQVTVPQLLAGNSNGLEMFYDCDSLTRVDCAPNARFIPDGAFRDCDSLTAVTLGESINTVGQQAFYSCPKLTSVNLSALPSLETIGPLAFCRTALPAVSLPASIREIGLNAFGINRALTSIQIPEGNPGGYYSTDGVLYQNNNGSVLLVRYPAGKPQTTFTVPGDVTAIETYAFSHSEKLTEVTFPTSLREIGYYALSHCINLTAAIIPEGVKQGNEIFEGSYHMTQATLPSDIVKLTSSSFPVNSKLTSVTLPSTVAEIDTVPGPFSSLSLLQEIKVDPANPNFKSVDGVLFSKDGSILYAYPQGKTGSEYVVPDGVTTIWYSAFSGVTSLTRLTLPASVTTVRPSACYGMSNLERLDIFREMPAIDRNPNGTEAYNTFLSNTGSQLQVYVHGNPTDETGVSAWIDSFKTHCAGEGSIQKQNIHVDFYKPATAAGDRFLKNGIVYTLLNPTAKTVKVGDNSHYAGSSVFIPTQVSHQGVSYTVSSVDDNAFPSSVRLIRREDLSALTPENTTLTYGDTLILNAPSNVRENTAITLTAGGKSLSAPVKGGAASFPVDKTMANAFGFGTVTASASGGAVSTEFSLTLSPKTFTKEDLPWYNSAMQELVIQKPYDGTTVLDYTDSAALQTFTVNGETLSLHITGTVPAPRSTTLHSISNLKLELLGDTAQYYRIAPDVAPNIRAQVTYGQLYLKEENGTLQQPAFRRVWAAEDGMRLKDCNLSGGAFIAYLPTVENNVITGYTQVDVSGSITYDEASPYPGLTSYDEIGVQQNQVYKWVFTPSNNGDLQSVLDNYRFYGTIKPWDTSLTQSSANAVGRTGENPALPAYVLQTQSDNAPARPTGGSGTAAPTPTSTPSSGSTGGSSGGSSSGGSSGSSSKNPATPPAAAPEEPPVVAAAPTPPPVSQRFRDVSPNSWYCSAIQYVCDRGMMNGMDQDSFAPDAVTTRGTIVTMLYRLEEEPSVPSPAFHDVSAGLWYAGGVSWDASTGLVNGFEDGAFRPETPITREQMVAILYRYARQKGCDVSARADLSRFSDAGQISPYAAAAMSWATASGLIQGQDWGGLDPAGATTRAELSAILMRLCENILK
ncbi:MAG: leucine-rich repeat protein [Oscillospiraceae bacterium]|nr:leucine-rich repeat protein [Oscillospiraceae bacterium]